MLVILCSVKTKNLFIYQAKRKEGKHFCSTLFFARYERWFSHCRMEQPLNERIERFKFKSEQNLGRELAAQRSCLNDSKRRDARFKWNFTRSIAAMETLFLYHLTIQRVTQSKYNHDKKKKGTRKMIFYVVRERNERCKSLRSEQR